MLIGRGAVGPSGVSSSATGGGVGSGIGSGVGAGGGGGVFATGVGVADPPFPPPPEQADSDKIAEIAITDTRRGILACFMTLLPIMRYELEKMRLRTIQIDVIQGFANDI